MVLDFIFGFLTAFPPVLAVFLYAVIIMFLINIPYKYLVDQAAVYENKQKIKEITKKSREAQKAGNTDEVKKLMSESMSLNSKQMKSTMKPMLVSFVVVIIFLPWLASTYGDLSVPANNTVSINGHDVNITQYSVPTYKVNIDNRTWNIIDSGNGVVMQSVVVQLPTTLPFVGDDLGWLAWYFIASIPLMIIIRKLMGINL